MSGRLWFGVLAAKDGESSIVVYDGDNQPQSGRVRLYRLKNHAIFEADKEDARRRIRPLEPEERGLIGYAVTSYYAARRDAAKEAADIGEAMKEARSDAETAAIAAHRGPDLTQCELCGGTGEMYEPGKEFCGACGGTGWLSMG